MKPLATLATLAILFGVGGCAAIEQANRANTERLLSAAGFRIIPANNPQRQKSLASMTPYEVTRRFRGEEVFYFYGDPAQNIAYVGDQEAYSRYRNLELQQEIADENMSAAQLNMSAASQWNDWPVWTEPGALPPPRMGGGGGRR